MQLDNTPGRYSYIECRRCSLKTSEYGRLYDSVAVWNMRVGHCECCQKLGEEYSLLKSWFDRALDDKEILAKEIDRLKARNEKLESVKEFGEILIEHYDFYGEALKINIEALRKSIKDCEAGE
jgi:hypothetical protein